jgi:aarF domain-containing kinase
MESVIMEARKVDLLLSRLNVSELLTKVFNTLLTHHVKLDPCFASLILAIMVLEGLGKSLDPEMNIIMKAAPYLVKS